MRNRVERANGNANVVGVVASDAIAMQAERARTGAALHAQLHRLIGVGRIGERGRQKA
jgi:hypothetical protein